MKPDAKWFKERITESQYGSVRQLAQHMKTRTGGKIDPSALSRSLSGDRELILEGLHEVRLLADLLGVPMGEVIRRLGFPFGKRDNV